MHECKRLTNKDTPDSGSHLEKKSNPGFTGPSNCVEIYIAWQGKGIIQQRHNKRDESLLC